MTKLVVSTVGLLVVVILLCRHVFRLTWGPSKEESFTNTAAAAVGFAAALVAFPLNEKISHILISSDLSLSNWKIWFVLGSAAGLGLLIAAPLVGLARNDKDMAYRLLCLLCAFFMFHSSFSLIQMWRFHLAKGAIETLAEKKEDFVESIIRQDEEAVQRCEEVMKAAEEHSQLAEDILEKCAIMKGLLGWEIEQSAADLRGEVSRLLAYPDRAFNVMLPSWAFLLTAVGYFVFTYRWPGEPLAANDEASSEQESAESDSSP